MQILVFISEGKEIEISFLTRIRSYYKIYYSKIFYSFTIEISQNKRYIMFTRKGHIFVNNVNQEVKISV